MQLPKHGSSHLSMSAFWCDAIDNNTLGLAQNDYDCADDIFKVIFFNGILFKFYLNVYPLAPFTESHQWSKNWLGVCLVSSHYLNQLYEHVASLA